MRRATLLTVALAALLATACSTGDEELGPYRLEAYEWEEGTAEGEVDIALDASLDVGSLARFLPDDVASELEDGALPVSVEAMAQIESQVTRDGEASTVRLTLSGADGKATTPFGTRRVDDAFVREIGDGGTLVIRVEPNGVVEAQDDGLFAAFGFPGGEVWTGYDCAVLPEDGVDPGETWQVDQAVPLSDRGGTAVSMNAYEQLVVDGTDVADVTAELAGGVTQTVSPDDVLELLGASIPLPGMEFDTSGTLELSRACVFDIPRQRLRRSATTGTLDAQLEPSGDAGFLGAFLEPIDLHMDFTIMLSFDGA